MRLWFDCETFSECDLKAHGTHRYAEHPSTEITVAQWAIDDGEPVVVDCTEFSHPAVYPTPLDALLHNPAVMVIAHNSHFDRTLLRHCWGIDVPIERWYDTMVQGLAHGLPGSLDKMGQVLGHAPDQAKDKRGRELIQLFCKPRPKGHKLRRATRETHPKEWAEFLEYSRQDIVAMRAVSRDLPNWNYKPGHPELALWHLDQKINDRGFQVDLALAQGAIEAVAREQARLKQEVQEATDGMVSSPSKRDALLAYILAEYGVTLPDMAADTLRRRLEDPELPEGVKLLISLRLEATKTSTAKYKALVNATSADGRLRNTLQFAGAQRTTRWAGRIFQPQNLPRYLLEAIAAYFLLKDVKEVTEDHVLVYLADGVEAITLGFAHLVFPDVMALSSNLVRSCIVAPPDRKLGVVDLANIEGRGLAFLAGETWKLKAFAEFDTTQTVDGQWLTGPQCYELVLAGRTPATAIDKKGEPVRRGADMYKSAYARAFNIGEDAVTKYMRQIGKVMELGCLAGDTPVITNNGVKAIMAVSSTDLLWDGQEWVGHCGVVAKGVKPVVCVAGIALTPDHLVQTGKTWAQAQELFSNESILCQALATGLENWSSSGLNAPDAAHATTTWCACSARVGPSPISSSTTTCAKEPAPGAMPAPRSSRPTGAKSTTATPTSRRIQSTEPGFWIASRRVSAGATTRTTQATKITAAVASSCMNPGAKIGALFSRIWSLLKAGITHALNWTASGSTKGTSPETYASSPTKPTRATEEKCETCKPESLNLKPTFDILNSGSQNKFTVLTDRGPVIVHNCGYEGGVGAFLTFAAVYGMDLDELSEAVWENASEEALQQATGMLKWTKKKGRSTFGLSDRVWIACETLVLGWREAHPNTKALWAAAKEGVTLAIDNPGQSFKIGQHLIARRDGAWLRIRLPSGRYLCYLQPKVDGEQISYMGVDQYTRQWKRVKTYGGKIVENCTQAFARDIMAHNMQFIEDSGYSIVLSVHDELLTEAPDDPKFNADDLSARLARRPPWAMDIPLAAAGFECYRYRKE